MCPVPNPNDIPPAKAPCPHPWDPEGRDKSTPLKSLSPFWSTSITNPGFVKQNKTKQNWKSLGLWICPSFYSNRPTSSPPRTSLAKMETGHRALRQTTTLWASSGVTFHSWENAGMVAKRRCCRRGEAHCHSAQERGLQYHTVEKKEEGDGEQEGQWQWEISWQGAC